MRSSSPSRKSPSQSDMRFDQFLACRSPGLRPPTRCVSWSKEGAWAMWLAEKRVAAEYAASQGYPG